MHRSSLRHVGLVALAAAFLLALVGQSRAQASPSDSARTRADTPQADAAAEISLAGLWDFGDGLVVEIEQNGASITSKVLKFECSGASWEKFLTGDVAGETLSGTMQRCAPDTHFSVSDCGMEALWDTPFEAVVSRHEIVGTFTGQWLEYDTVDGRATNCRLDHLFDDNFTGSRLDCRPLTFEELAEEHPAGAEHVSLSKEFEGGKTVHWTPEQVENGFKGRAEYFVSAMGPWGYPGGINSAFRPLLYQAHFADLRECGLTLIKALQTWGHEPELVTAIAKGVTALKAEVAHHGIKSEITTLAGQSVPVPFVCYRDPLEACPHVDGKAIDASFRPDDGIDWVGAIQGWCRRYLPVDPPHWEEISQGRCGQGFGPGRADINITVESPVAVMLTDAYGQRIGQDPSAGAAVNDLGEGAFYTGAESEPQRLFAPGAVLAGDEVEIALTATGDGPYKVRLGFLSEDGIESSEVVLEGVARLGEPIAPTRHTFQPSTDEPLHPEAIETTPEDGWERSFETTIGADRYVVSVNSASPEAIFVNPNRRAVGLRLPDGPGGEASVRAPSAIIDKPVRVLVDGRDVPSSVEVVNGFATVRFAVPPGRHVVEIRGQDAGTPGGLPILPILVALLAIGLLIALLLILRRRRDRPRLSAP